MHLTDMSILTLTKLKNPWGKPGNTSSPVAMPSAFSFLAIMMQSSRQGSMSTV